MKGATYMYVRTYVLVASTISIQLFIGCLALSDVLRKVTQIGQVPLKVPLMLNFNGSGLRCALCNDLRVLFDQCGE